MAFDPLDLSYGERWAADSALACKGEGLGFRDLALIEANEAMITEICPEYLCLGERACRFPDAKVNNLFSLFSFLFFLPLISIFLDVQNPCSSWNHLLGYLPCSFPSFRVVMSNYRNCLFCKPTSAFSFIFL